jgi:hypothetical protein
MDFNCGLKKKKNRKRDHERAPSSRPRLNLCLKRAYNFDFSSLPSRAFSFLTIKENVKRKGSSGVLNKRQTLQSTSRRHIFYGKQTQASQACPCLPDRHLLRQDFLLSLRVRVLLRQNALLTPRRRKKEIFIKQIRWTTKVRSTERRGT